MNIRLDGKTAIVCGSSKGIGKAVALQMAESGANVYMIARSDDLLKAACSELPQTGSQQHGYMAADMGDYTALDAIAAKVIEKYGKVDILVNNSGGPAPGALADAKIEDFMAAFERHLFASHTLMQAVLPGMKQNNFGRIINVISISVRQPVPGLGVSNTLRGAMASWSKTLSRELGGFGITVNNLLPGQTRTQRLENLFRKEAEGKGVDVSEIEAATVAKIPAGRIGEPEELAYAAAFLASEQAAFINGVNLQVDGGFINSI
jgi:3-oxoacyl-[acyl-carrier protein] reductase